ncbi:MAG: hypothetical protein H3C58_04470 [Fimbriimonadaceae bacterium]|nr:hypothetical protein [Fimbriimonadaceae bacterium]
MIIPIEKGTRRRVNDGYYSKLFRGDGVDLSGSEKTQVVQDTVQMKDSRGADWWVIKVLMATDEGSKLLMLPSGKYLVALGRVGHLAKVIEVNYDRGGTVLVKPPVLIGGAFFGGPMITEKDLQATIARLGVTAKDFTEFSIHFNHELPALYADYDLDGAITQKDVDIVRANLGKKADPLPKKMTGGR